MDSAMIGKIQKAKQYAEQPELIQFTHFEVKFKGGNNSHTLSFNDGRWTCTCSFFQSRGVCSHTMAMERILGEMLEANTD